MTRPDRNDGIINAALIALGALAVTDNTSSTGCWRSTASSTAGDSIYVEVLLVVIGAAMLTVGFVRGASGPASDRKTMAWRWTHAPKPPPRTRSREAIVMSHRKRYGA